MSTKIRECVKALEKGKNLEEWLPEYGKESARLHAGYSICRLVMEYYTFYEMLAERGTPCPEASGLIEMLHGTIRSYLDWLQGEEMDQEGLSKLEADLLKLRRQVTEGMDVLTAYVDRLVIYEYVLNRLQYRFEDREMISEDSVFAQSVIQYIFGMQDNVVVNDRIHSVLGQLPVRMTKQHYFDLIRDSISVYKDSDKASLDGYLYMFRTNAMLYQTDGMKQHFKEFIPVLEEFAALDYAGMTAEEYRIYADKLRNTAARLNDITDLYMMLAQLVNSLYAILLSKAGKAVWEEIPGAVTVMRGVNQLFLRYHEDSIWSALPEDADEEEKLYWLGNQFVSLEGKQERYMDGLTTADAVLEETRKAWKDEIRELGLSDEFMRLSKLEKLSSGSNFMELEEADGQQPVTPEMARQASESLVGELEELFRHCTRHVRRAVMANTLEKMPVFFTTPQEVADYISRSLAGCDDEAEKYASKQLIQQLMES